MYYEGRGVEKDDKKTATLFHRAAIQGDADSQFHLAVMYEAGEGVAQDLARATVYFRMAADQGKVKAQLRLFKIFTGVTPVMIN